jgi:hypothetical protein
MLEFDYARRPPLPLKGGGLGKGVRFGIRAFDIYLKFVI